MKFKKREVEEILRYKDKIERLQGYFHAPFKQAKKSDCA